MITSHQELASHLAKGDRTIGALVYWRGLAGAKVARPILRQGFAGAGLEGAVPDPSTEKMLTDACARASGKLAGGDAVKVELKSKTSLSTHRVMMRRFVDGRARYVEEAHAAVDRYAAGAQLQTTTLDGVPADSVRDEVLADIRQWFGEIQTHALGTEISDALVGAMEILGALTLRQGVYFVTAAGLERARQLAKFIGETTDATVTIYDMRDTTENSLAARTDARAAFLDRLDALKHKVAKFTAETTVEAAKPRSVSTKIADFKELACQVDAWADVLGGAADELRASIGDAKQALLGKYMGLVDDKSEA